MPNYDALLAEVGRVISADNETKINAAIKALQSVLSMNSSDSTTESERPLTEATWDTKFVNALPDSAFLYIAPGGTKDSDGKTLPRENRYFPVYDDAGKIDLPHLRNALARIPQSKLDKAAKDSSAAKAQELAKKYLPKKESMAEAGFMSFNDIRSRLNTALQARLNMPDSVDGPWVQDVFDDRLIYSLAGKMYQLDYSIDDKGNVTLGDPFEVMQVTTYEPVTEAGTEILAGDFVPLEEKAVAKDGTTQLKIISPGWGSSGYYSKEMLARDALVYKPGTKMYWDHPTESEERERPERSLRDLAGELTSTGVYKEDGPRGPGVYAKAKIFEHYQAPLEDLAPHIGLSHRALGKAVTGEAEGKKGPIIEKLVAAKSVDFVTTPGRGGEVVQMFEAARDKSIQIAEEANAMEEAQIKELEEAKKSLEAENARLKEAQILREARDLAAEKVGASKLPEITQERLVESLAGKPVVKEGALDVEEFGKVVDEAIKAEAAYITQLTGIGSGKITGMGESTPVQESEKSLEEIEDSFKRIGLSESAAKIAAKGR